MPQNPKLPLLKCSMCGYSSKNHFIFGRHHQRCLRENGLSSIQSSTPAKEKNDSDDDLPLKGKSDLSKVTILPEGNLPHISKGESGSRVKDVLDGKTSLATKEPLVSGTALESELVLDHVSLPKPEVDSEHNLIPNDKVSLDAKIISKTKLTSTESEESIPIPSSEQDNSILIENSEGQQLDAEGTEQNPSTSAANGETLPPPNVSRNYRCGQCSFATTKSKAFLYHQIDNHRARIYIYPCSFCEYASRYKHKLARHVTFAHKKQVSMNEMLAENTKPRALVRQKQMVFAAHKMVKSKRITVGRSSTKKKTLDAMLLKLKGKIKISDASLSAFCTDLSTQQKWDKTDSSSGNSQQDMYKCKLCLFTGKSKNHVMRHVYACHVNARLFRCNLCNYKTHSQIEFYAHKNKHSTKNATVFKCTECSYATDFKPNFERHNNNHGSNKPNKCSLCNYATDHEGALKRHVTSHHPNTAENLSLIAGENQESVLDVPKVPESQEDEDGLELESDGFRCPICNLAYRRCADLNRHMKSKHNIRRKDFFDDQGEGEWPEDIEPVDPVEDGERIDLENVDLDTKDELTEKEEDEEESRPLADLLPKQKYKNLKCSYCSYIAKWPSDLRRHLLVHSVEKRFKCTLCWKKYKYLGDLNVHMRRDHEVDPAEDIVPEKVTTIPIKKNSPSIFRCPACPYTTKWKAEMERHSHIHTEKKSYCCRLCDYQTYWRGDMGRHLYRHHPEHVSKESELSNYFEYNPERKAIKLKLKRLRETHSDTPECDEQITNTLAEESINDSISDTLSLSDSLSTTSSRVTASKEDGKLFKCDHCSFTNYVPSRMRSHMDTHYNLKQFKCPVCGCRANWKYDIRKHMKQKHPDCTEDVQMLTRKEAKATIKHYMDTMPNIRRDHHLNADDQDEDIERKKPVVKKWRYKCSECVYCSQYRWSVSKHQRTVHQGQTCLSIIALRREDKGTENVIDGKSAENDSPDVRQPQRIAKQKQQSMSSDKSGKSKTADGDGKYMYECSECGKQGSSKGAIKKHYNYIHPNSEVRIIFLGDGTEFNYYTGLPVESPIKATNRSPVTSANQSSSSNPDIASPSRGGKLDSKLSNPKEHGYVKPFQCSVCGQRSNWKWDVKKHLRVKHAGMNGYVIVLQLDEARATYPGHQSSKISHTAYSDLDHPSPSKKLDVDKESMSSNSSILESSEASLQSCAMTYKKQEMMLGRFRRYKCSVCHYRSNWRTDVLRHIERRHGDRAQIIFMDVETAKQTFMDYDYQREVPGAGGQSINSRKSVSFRQSGKAAGQQLGTWGCPRCVFKSAVKTHIIRHMQSHGMKPFNCSVCGFTSRFRGPVYRHIRTQHKDVEYIKHARIIIKYAKSKLSTPAFDIDPESTTAVYIDAFLCRLCNLESESKVTLLQHLKVKHSCCDPNQALQIRKRIRVSNSLDAESGNNCPEAEDDDETSSFEDSSGSKQYFCTICPYHSDKRSMLTFHHTYHQPSSQKKYKCKLCPYYVCAPRQLHQHMKWHSGSIEGSSTTISQEISTSWQNWMEKIPTYSPSKHPKFPLDASPKKHQCEKCPYTTNSKNDILYHKQFHRPKPAAEYKCELCDYWVTHRRLLKQHARLHGIHYSNGESESSLTTSPNKSLASDASAVYDAVEIAAIKQKMIATKIMASLSTSPAVSPMKIATQCSVGNRPGFVLRNGAYHVLHRCRKCPYTNVRARNLRLHELMHGPRKADHPLMKCPYCDYYVGSKGLLSHHMKVHLHHYLPDPGDNSTYDLERSEGVATAPIEADDDAGSDAIESPEIPQKQKVDTLLEISRFKKYSCEKCPYASGKRAHFTRHMELHGSRQRHTCEYCDYSVPSGNLLTQHHKIHLMPNQNLLATQSFSNLQHMNEVPADVALASALPPTDSAEPVTISIIHDHLELYENDDANAMDLEPRKLYRCDRCPYANVRRDHLLTHLCFHLHLSTFQCPYCDYSAPKQQLLTQHIRVHFCPLPELADWLTENGQAERAQEVNDIDLTQALEVAEKFQSSPKRKLLDLQAFEKKTAVEGNGESGSVRKTKKSRAENSLPQNGITAKISKSQSSIDKFPSTFTAEKMDGEQRVFEDDVGTSAIAQEMPHAEGLSLDSSIYICQYCDRELITSKRLISHEMQHLIGNHFEFAPEATSKDGTPQTMSKIKENNEHVITVGIAQEEGVSGEEVKMQEKPNKAQTFELEGGNILLDHRTDSLKPSKPGKTEYKQLEDGINPPEPRMQIQTSTEESQFMTFKGGSIEDS